MWTRHFFFLNVLSFCINGRICVTGLKRGVKRSASVRELTGLGRRTLSCPHWNGYNSRAAFRPQTSSGRVVGCKGSWASRTCCTDPRRKGCWNIEQTDKRCCRRSSSKQTRRGWGGTPRTTKTPSQSLKSRPSAVCGVLLRQHHRGGTATHTGDGA